MRELFQLLFWPKRIGNALHVFVFAGVWMTAGMVALAIAVSPFVPAH